MRSTERTRVRRHWWTIMAILILSAVGPGGLSGAADPEGPAAERLRQMKAMAKTFAVTELNATGRRPVAPEAEPIFRYDEPARGMLDGTIWVFGGHGRPVAALKAEIRAPGILYGLVSLAPGNVSAEGINGWMWTSTRPGLTPTPTPGAPAPGASVRERLLQMKGLSRRFSVIEDDGPVHGKLTLRLLPQPLHRYADPASGILDGTIFGFVTGTNPDVLLLIEAAETPGGSGPTWQYGFARIGGADLSGRLDGGVVWHVPVAPVPSNHATYANINGPRNDLRP